MQLIMLLIMLSAGGQAQPAQPEGALAVCPAQRPGQSMVQLEPGRAGPEGPG